LATKNLQELRRFDLEGGLLVTDTAQRRLRRLIWGVLILGTALGILMILATRRAALVGQALRQIQPGLPNAEVRALLKPLRADFLSRRPNQAGGENFYSLRGVDEWVEIEMEYDKDKDGLCVRQVVHMPDGGPWWERMRRNLHELFR
jgi:hypothetical protein